MKLLIRTAQVNVSNSISKMHIEELEFFRNALINVDRNDSEYIENNINSVISWIKSIDELTSKMIMNGDYYAINSLCDIIMACLQAPNLDIQTFSITAENISNQINKEFLGKLDDVFESATISNISHIHMFIDKTVADKLTRDIFNNQRGDIQTRKTDIYNGIIKHMDGLKFNLEYVSITDNKFKISNKPFESVVRELSNSNIKTLKRTSLFDNINNVDDILNNDDLFTD